MKLTDSDLRDLHQSAAVAESRRDCPSADHLARAAMGELPDAERDALADHLTACAACAGEYRTIAPVRALMSEKTGIAVARRRLVPATYAAAAAVIAAVGLASTVWTTIRLRETERQLAAAPILEQRLPAVAQPPAPQVNVPILDLSPRDGVRGGPDAPEREQRLVVPADAPSLALILTTTARAADPRYSLEILDGAGVRVWITEGLQPARDGSFTLTMPPSRLPAGSYRFLLKRAPSAGGTLVEEYLVRIEYS
jgi:hypothetical protein